MWKSGECMDPWTYMLDKQFRSDKNSADQPIAALEGPLLIRHVSFMRSGIMNAVLAHIHQA